MGSTRFEVSLEALRFHYLIVQLEREGLSQRDMAEKIGCHQSLISKWRRPDARRTGIGAEIVGGCKRGLRLDPDFFYGDYEGERDYRRYLMTEASKSTDNRGSRKSDQSDAKAAAVAKYLVAAQELLDELATATTQGDPGHPGRRRDRK